MTRTMQITHCSNLADVNNTAKVTPYGSFLLDTSSGMLYSVGQSGTALLAVKTSPLVLNEADVFSDFVVSGLLSPTSGSLSSTLSAGAAYVTGSRTAVGATAYTYTASQDTYVDLTADGVLHYLPVANGAAAPAQTANSLRLQKVVTSASMVTNVVQLAPKAPANQSGTKPGNLFSFLGDSTTQASDQETGIAGITKIYYSDSWPSYACMISGQSIRRVKNAAIYGNTTAQMLSRVQSDVLAYSPTVCVVLGGTNDIGHSVSAGGTIPDATVFSTFQSNIRSIVQILQYANTTPLLVTILPNNSSARHALISQCNVWLRRYAGSNSITLLDFYAQAVDPATGNYAASMASTDGTHPGVAGDYLLGKYAANNLKPLLPLSSSPVTHDDLDPYNIIGHGCFLGGAIGANGIPPGWYIYSGFPTGVSVVYTTDPNVIGNMLKVSLSASSGVYDVGYTLPTSKWSPGDVLAVSGIITSDGGITPTVALIDQSTSVGTPLAMSSAMTLCTYYGEITVPSTSISLDLILSYPAGTANIQFGQLSIYNLTKMGALT